MIQDKLQQKLETQKWFNDLNDKMKEIITQQTFVTISQKDIVTNLKKIEDSVKELKIKFDKTQFLFKWFEPVSKLEYAIDEFNTFQKDPITGGLISSDPSYEKFLAFWFDDGGFYISQVKKMVGAIKGGFLTGDIIWESEDGAFCQEAVREYFIRILYLAEIIRDIYRYVRGYRPTPDEHYKFITDKRKIRQVFKDKCYSKYF